MKTTDPLTVAYADQNSSEETRKQQFPIMSTSKSFCGAVCALMAADKKFGENGINATLHDVLEAAKNPVLGIARDEKISNYLKMLQDKGLQDVRISDLLSHRSGVADILLPYDREQDYTDKFDFFKDKIERQEASVPKQFGYSNTGYELLEEIIDLVSDKGGYLNELRQRVLQPLEISTTTVPLVSSPQAKDRIGIVHIAPEHEAPFGGKSPAFRSYSPLELHPGKQGSLAAGALCSTVDDMEKYSQELAKMVSGQASELTKGRTPQEMQAIHQYYKDSRGDNGYSLGLAIVENKGQCIIQKGGRFPGNKSDMAITMPFSLKDFMEDKTDLEGQEPQTHLYMQQRCFLVDKVNDKYQDFLKDYFLEAGKDSAIADKFITQNAEGKPVNGEWRKNLNEWRDELIANGKLAPDFKEFQERICENLGDVCKEIYDYLDNSDANHSKDGIENFKNNKLAEAFNNAATTEDEKEFVVKMAKACGVDLEASRGAKKEVEGEVKGAKVAEVAPLEGSWQKKVSKQSGEKEKGEVSPSQ